MSKNWAIVIGINQYNPNNFTALKYAKRDAELMRDFFQQAQFDEVCFFTDDSPDLKLPNGSTIHTRPTLGNLRSFLHDRFATKPFLSTGDNCWFFFAGHGGQHQNRDYLMPQDANPRDIDYTAIPVSHVRERLLRSGADNVILILDACRTEGDRSSGVGTELHQGVITISACSPTQKSWEIDELHHGAFTYALHEALQIPGERNCATVERLDQYLRYRVPELCRQYRKFPEQTPRVAVDPREKSHFILLSQYATSADVDSLKKEAYRLAFMSDQINLAEHFCIRANAAALGQDLEVLNLYVKIKNSQSGTLLDQTAEIKNEATQHPNHSTLSNAYQGGDEDGLSGTEMTKYGHLRDLLKAGQWSQADEETQNLILKLAKRVKARWLSPDSIDKLPCKDLCTIDALWVKHSNQQFGFSVQKKIYAECGGSLDGRYQDFVWKLFCNRVGWRIEGKWASYSSFVLDLSAPQGQLPSGVRVNQPNVRARASGYWKACLGDNYVEETNLIGWHYFFARLEACRL